MSFKLISFNTRHHSMHMSKTSVSWVRGNSSHRSFIDLNQIRKWLFVCESIIELCNNYISFQLQAFRTPFFPTNTILETHGVL